MKLGEVADAVNAPIAFCIHAAVRKQEQDAASGETPEELTPEEASAAAPLVDRFMALMRPLWDAQVRVHTLLGGQEALAWKALEEKERDRLLLDDEARSEWRASLEVTPQLEETLGPAIRELERLWREIPERYNAFMREIHGESE